MIDFTTIEHNEEPAGSPYDWRGAYRKRIHDNIVALAADHAAQSRQRYYIGTRTYVVKDMDVQQRESLARLLAERDCERAIRERDEGVKAEKIRKGIAA